MRMKPVDGVTILWTIEKVSVGVEDIEGESCLVFAISRAGRVRVCGRLSFTVYIVIIEFGLIVVGTISAVRVTNWIAEFLHAVD